MGAETVCTFIFLLFMLAVPIAMVCVGAMQKDNCPLENNIPIFMIVSGAVGIFSTFVTMCWQCAGEANKDGMKKGTSIVLLIVMLFNFAWSIAGSVWVFKHWSSRDNWKNFGNLSCNNDLYLFAFAILIIFWIALPCTLGGIAKRCRDSSA